MAFNLDLLPARLEWSEVRTAVGSAKVIQCFLLVEVVNGLIDLAPRFGNIVCSIGIDLENVIAALSGRRLSDVPKAQLSFFPTRRQAVCI